MRNKSLLNNKYFTRKKIRNIKQIEKSIIKMEQYKLSQLLKDSTEFKFVTKIRSK